MTHSTGRGSAIIAASLPRRRYPMNDSPILPAHAFLDRMGIRYERRSFPPSTQKGAAAVAHALGYAEHQMVKTLIFETDRSEVCLIMLGGDQSALSSNLKKVLGSRDIHLATPDKVVSVTGYVIGSIPPFHWQPAGFRTFLDASLLRETILGVGTGQWGEEILLAPLDLVRASAGQVVNLTDRNSPIFPPPPTP